MQEKSGHSSFRQVAPLVVLVAALCGASYYVAPLIAENAFQQSHTMDGGTPPIEGYEEIIHPKTAQAFYNSANVRYHIGDLAGTVKDCTKAIELDPKNAEAVFLRANALFDDEKYKEALKEYNKAVELDPTNAKIFLERGRCNTVLDKPKAAMADYDRAVELDQSDPAIYCARAYMRGVNKNTRGAIEDLTAAEKLDARDAWIPFQRGNEKLTLGDKQGALEDYNKSLSILPDYAPVLWNRARLRCDLGDRIEGHKDIDAAIEIDPKEAYARRVRAGILIEEGNDKEAKKDLKIAEDLEKENEKRLEKDKQKKKKKKRYELIEDPLVYKFCADTLAQEQKVFGPAKVPIKRLYIYYRTGKSCQTTMVDEKRGVFVICMANDEHVDIYYYSLVHELMHLLNTKIADPFIEGTCTLFVDHTNPPNQRKFKLWSKRYQRGVLRLRFYAETYLMVKELEKKLSLPGLSKLLTHLDYNTGSKDWMHIDSDSWLETIPEPKREAARQIIAKYADVIENHLPDDGAYGFDRPYGTKRKDGKVKDQYGKTIRKPGDFGNDRDDKKTKAELERDEQARRQRWPMDYLREVKPEEGKDLPEPKPSSPLPAAIRQS